MAAAPLPQAIKLLPAAAAPGEKIGKAHLGDRVRRQGFEILYQGGQAALRKCPAAGKAAALSVNGHQASDIGARACIGSDRGPRVMVGLDLFQADDGG